KSASTRKPTIPFSPYDHTLLIGEGDFSFAASLITDHALASLVATAFDSEEEVHAKYPSSAAHISTITSTLDAAEDDVIRYSIDATTLHRTFKKQRFRRIVFNFPHVGGKSTDVNRQVRANQALLAAFFESVKGLLDPVDSSVLVTLFERVPYTLWNIRDLARHAGLTVLRSFAFDKSTYPTYRHARTLGVVRKGGEDGQEESESAWKGEDRAARVYEFGLKRDEDGGGKKRRKKRKAGEESSDSE
ncbi:hypothetical protein BT63DRAFT_387765, partial [Microthyrium microscopicum]